MAPNAPRPGTSVHTFRCEDQLWTDAARLAKERGESVSEVLRAALVAYVGSGARK